MTATDQVGRKIKREVDGLGRLVKVTEQDVSTGLLTQETTYSYNLLDKLVGVNQGGQTRSYKYDAIGRLLYERIPEQTATINDGTGTMWSCKYTYTEFGGVATKQDARGVITTFTYDALHHVTQKSYDTSAAPGVAATSPVTFGYTSSGLLSNVSAGIYSESSWFDAYNRLASMARNIDSRSYATWYQYNGASHITQIGYPSGNVVGVSYDDRGRPSAEPGYLSGMSYNIAGQVTGLTLGNGVVESYGYDSQRMQLTSQNAAKPGYAAVMSLAYSYQAQAGQSGAGTTAGNSGQLMGVVCCSSIGGSAELASYTYDDLGRLTTSNQTSNGVSAQRRFAYDRWGNRTGVWDATSGGNQIQSVTLQQSGGAPTNQIASVTSGSSVNYVYDAAGNVTNDGAHSYQYDAENRLVSVDNGATAQYWYDHQNRRVKKAVGSSVTHYIWEGSHVIAEHDGNTPVGGSCDRPYGERSSLVDYVYLGSRLISSRHYTHNCGTTWQWCEYVGYVQQPITCSTDRYYLSDRLSTRLVLDASGNVIGRQGHLPFGEDFAESGTQEKHHFTSYERDGESGTDYALNRRYTQSTGRFNRPDPRGLSMDSPVVLGSYGDPQSLNRYNYARNDPINLQDPKGGLTCSGTVYYLDFYLNGIYLFSIYLGFVPTSCTNDSSVQAPSVIRSLPPLRDRDARRADDARRRAATLTQNANCDQAMQYWGIPSLSALVADLQLGDVDEENIPSGNIFDGRTSQLKVKDDDGITDVTVQQYFQRHPNVNAIELYGRDGLIFLGPGFFNLSNDEKAIALIHEAVHRAGLPDTEFGATREEGSQNLTTWLRDN